VKHSADCFNLSGESSAFLYRDNPVKILIRGNASFRSLKNKHVDFRVGIGSAQRRNQRRREKNIADASGRN